MPAFFVNGRFIAGAQPFEVFKARIAAELARIYSGKTAIEIHMIAAPLAGHPRLSHRRMAHKSTSSPRKELPCPFRCPESK